MRRDCRPSRRNRFLIAALLLLAGAPLAAQQIVEDLDDERPEAWSMRWFSGIATPTSYGAPQGREPWSLEIGFEGGFIPSLSAEQRTVGFNGTKEENLNRSPFFGRPVATLALPAEVTLSAGWVPPIDFDGVEPNLWSFALARPFWTGPRSRLGGQVAYLTGDLTGDITCPADEAAAGDDPIANPFECEQPSNDTLSIDAWTFELAFSFAVGERVELFFSGLMQQLDSHFQVRARYAGVVDDTLLIYDGNSWGATAGFAWRTSERTRLSGELFYMPLDVVRDPQGVGPSENDPLWNARLMFGYMLR